MKPQTELSAELKGLKEDICVLQDRCGTLNDAAQKDVLQLVRFLRNKVQGVTVVTETANGKAKKKPPSAR